MCAGASLTIRGDEVSVYMGYHGGRLEIGDVEYKSGKSDREEIFKKLSSYKKDEIISMILDIVDEADE